jgi:hypothetical protein
LPILATTSGSTGGIFRDTRNARGTVDLACAVSRPPHVQKRPGLPGLDAISGSCDELDAHRVVHGLVGSGSACSGRLGLLALAANPALAAPARAPGCA